jgi:hypothetical protein
VKPIGDAPSAARSRRRFYHQERERPVGFRAVSDQSRRPAPRHPQPVARKDLGSVAAAAAAVIEEMCDRVVEKRRSAPIAETVKSASNLASINSPVGRVPESQHGNALEIARSAA